MERCLVWGLVRQVSDVILLFCIDFFLLVLCADRKCVRTGLPIPSAGTNGKEKSQHVVWMKEQDVLEETEVEASFYELVRSPYLEICKAIEE